MVKRTLLKPEFDHVTAKELVRIIRGWRILFNYFWPPPIGQLRFQSVEVKKSRRGYHVPVSVRNDIPPVLIPFVQLCMRSHRAREILNLTRVLTPELQDGHEFNVLYNTKYRIIPDGLIQTGEEKPQPRLTKQVTRIIRGFRKRRVKKH